MVDEPLKAVRTRTWYWLLPLGVFVSLAWTDSFRVFGDEELRLDSLRRLLQDGTVPTVKWPMIGSVISAPWVALGLRWESLAYWAARFHYALLGVSLLVINRWLRRELEDHVRATFLTLVVCSSMGAVVFTGFGLEAFNSLCAMVGLMAMIRGHTTVGGIILSLGVANMPASLIGAGLACLTIAWHQRRLRVLVPLVLCVLLILAGNWVQHGGPFSSPYGSQQEAGYVTALPYSGQPGFSYPMALGLVSLLFSFGKGLFFFVPGMLLVKLPDSPQPTPMVRQVMLAWSAYVVGLLLVYSRWWAWYGGLTFGPRFLSFAAVPAALAMALWLSAHGSVFVQRVATVVVLVWSLWVGFAGLGFLLHHQELCMANQYQLEAFCWYVPEFSVLATPLIKSPEIQFRHMLLGCIFCIVFLVTAGPTLHNLGRRTISGLRDFRVTVNGLQWRW